MAKVVKGTKDATKVRPLQVVKGNKDVRQVRCVKCHNGFAIQVPDGQGGYIYDCQVCHTRFDFQGI